MVIAAKKKQNQKQKTSMHSECPSSREWLNKIWYVYSVALKRNEIE